MKMMTGNKFYNRLTEMIGLRFSVVSSDWRREIRQRLCPKWYYIVLTYINIIIFNNI